MRELSTTAASSSSSTSDGGFGQEPVDELERRAAVQEGHEVRAIEDQREAWGNHEIGEVRPDGALGDALPCSSTGAGSA